VFGLDSELLGLVPRPVAAVMLLFPITDKYEDARIEEDKKLEQLQGEADNANNGANSNKDDVFFVKQTIGNACGTMGLIHAICNNRDKLQIGIAKLSFFLKMLL